MDMLAERLGMSPLELRLRNLLRDGDRFATGETMHDVHFEECLHAAADAVGYEQDPRGKGLCVLLKGMQTPSRAAIAVERTPVGYTIRCASCEMGQGVRDSLRLQGAALLGCEPGQIEVPDPDTDSSPFDTRTTSSRSTYMMGRALREAVADLSANGGERGYGEIANEGGLDPDTGQGIASTHWHQGAAAAAGGRRRGDRQRDGRAPARRRLRGPRGRPRRRRAAERGLDDHGPRHRAVRAGRARGRPDHERQPVRLQRAGDRRPARAPHARADRARGRRAAWPRRDRTSARARRDRQRARSLGAAR